MRVLTKDQLNQGLPLTRAIANFHVIHQTKDILKQIYARTHALRISIHTTILTIRRIASYHKLLNGFGAIIKDNIERDQPDGGLGLMQVSYKYDVKSKVDPRYYHKANPKFPSTGLDNEYANTQSSENHWGNA